MNTIKRVVVRLYDLVSMPLTIVSAYHMWLLRRYGIERFPAAHRHLLWQGIFPIRRHFYEPQFHPDDLPDSFSEERELPGISFNIAEQLQLLSSFRWQTELQKFNRADTPVLENGTTFDLDNTFFGPGDIDFYYQAIRHLKPKRIIEIGSGYSTIVALSAIEENARENSDAQCEITAVEPFPWFTHPSLKVVQSKVETVPDSLFSTLQDGDVLFIDSSHVVRPRGDVVHEYLRLLPLLNAGVYIHVHDIFTPFDYPELWAKTRQYFWNEQYLLEALLSGGDKYEVCASLHYLSKKYPEQAKAAMPLLCLREKHPQSFWIRKKS